MSGRKAIWSCAWWSASVRPVLTVYWGAAVFVYVRANYIMWLCMCMTACMLLSRCDCDCMCAQMHATVRHTSFKFIVLLAITVAVTYTANAGKGKNHPNNFNTNKTYLWKHTTHWCETRWQTLHLIGIRMTLHVTLWKPLPMGRWMTLQMTWRVTLWMIAMWLISSHSMLGPFPVYHVAAVTTTHVPVSRLVPLDIVPWEWRGPGLSPRGVIARNIFQAKCLRLWAKPLDVSRH